MFGDAIVPRYFLNDGKNILNKTYVNYLINETSYNSISWKYFNTWMSFLTLIYLVNEQMLTVFRIGGI